MLTLRTLLWYCVVPRGCIVPRCLYCVPAGSSSRVGDVAVYVFDIIQSSLPIPFHSVVVPISVFMALLTVFHSINSPDNSLLSHFVVLVLFLPYLVLSTTYLFMKVSLRPDMILCG